MFDYFYNDDNEQYLFLQIPIVLVKDENFKKLSDSSKILYSLLLSRTNLSRKNGWTDKQNRVYIIYTIEEIMEDLNCWSEKATKAMKELKDIGLIKSVRTGLGKPNIIYVMNFATVLKYKNYSKNTNSNKDNTNKNSKEENTNSNNENDKYKEYTKIIKANIDYEIIISDFKDREDILNEIVTIMVEAVCSNKPYLRVNGEDKPASIVQSQLLKLDSEHIKYVDDCMKKNTTKIHNINNYLLSSLYNAPSTIGNYYQSSVNHDFYGNKDK